MMINTNAIFSASEANQNFSRVTRIADAQGQAVIFKNNKPKYLLVDIESTPYFDMTDDEKKQYEEDKRKEELDNREAAITRRELTAVAKEQLNAAGVPAGMADFIDYTDADSVNESVKRLSKAFKGAVQQSVDDRLKGKAPLDKAKNNVLTAEEENARKAFANALKF